MHAHLMDVRTVFTDHSLFGFDDAATILTNKLLVGALKNVDAVISVSYTGSAFTCIFEVPEMSLISLNPLVAKIQHCEQNSYVRGGRVST